MAWNLSVTTAPTQRPITIAQVKADLGIVHDDDDPLLDRMIRAATLRVEEFTGRKLVTQSVTAYLDGFPTGRRSLVIPTFPINSVVVKYDDTSEVEQTLSALTYRTLLTRVPPRIEMNEDESWPTTRSGMSSVRIEMSVGQAVTAVDRELKGAVASIVRHRWDNPGEDMPKAVRGLLKPYKVFFAAA